MTSLRGKHSGDALDRLATQMALAIDEHRITAQGARTVLGQWALDSIGRVDLSRPDTRRRNAERCNVVFGKRAA